MRSHDIFINTFLTLLPGGVVEVKKVFIKYGSGFVDAKKCSTGLQVIHTSGATIGPHILKSLALVKAAYTSAIRPSALRATSSTSVGWGWLQVDAEFINHSVIFIDHFASHFVTIDCEIGKMMPLVCYEITTNTVETWIIFAAYMAIFVAYSAFVICAITAIHASSVKS